MADRTHNENKAPAEQSREARLKAALKANLARRKAQSRQRAQTDVAQERGEEADKRDGD